MARKKLIRRGRQRFNLFPNEPAASLPRLYSQENLVDPVAYLRLFDPCVAFSFYAFEGCIKPDGDFAMFGFFRSPLGEGMAYVSLGQLESISGRYGLGIARDPLFRSARLSEIGGQS